MKQRESSEQGSADEGGVHLSEDGYRILAEHFVDPLFYATDGIVRWVAPSVADALGWSPEDMETTALSELVHVDDSEGLRRLLSRVAQGHPGRGVFRLRSKDGGYMWVLMTLGTEPDEEGHEAVYGSMREIDRRVQVERRLRLLTEHSSEVLYTSGVDQRITWMSPTVFRALGWTPDELVGTMITDLIHPDDQAISTMRMAPLYGGDRFATPVRGLIRRVRARDGTYRWMITSAAAVYTDDGQPDGVIGGLQDADEIVRARDMIKREATRAKAFLETMPDPHVIFSPVRDAMGRIVDFAFADINPAGAEYAGTTHDEIVGRTVSEIAPGFTDSVLFSRAVQVMTTGEPLITDDYLYPALGPSGADVHASIRAVRVGDQLSLLWRDVTEKILQEQALASSEEQYRLIAMNVGDVVVHLRECVVQYVSPSITDALGWDPQEWVGRSIHGFFHPEDLDRHRQGHDAIEAGHRSTYRARLRAKDLTYHWVSIHDGPYFDSHGVQDGVVKSIQVIDNVVAAEDELRRRARFDELTGLLNRREVMARITATTDHERRPGNQTAVLFCDIDRFKDVNDTYGHAVGDEVLRTIAERLDEVVRAGDTTARVGGDELLVILDNVHDQEEAMRVAEKIRLSVAEPLLAGEVTVRTSVSIGVTLARPGEETDALIARADAAMYQAKQEGRNRVVAIG